MHFMTRFQNMHNNFSHLQLANNFALISKMTYAVPAVVTSIKLFKLLQSL